MRIDVKTEVKDGNARCHFNVKQADNENISDMHYFCVSVIKDLVGQKHKIKAFGETETITYPFDFDDDMIEVFLDVMNYMQNIIIEKKLEDEKNHNKFSDN